MYTNRNLVLSSNINLDPGSGEKYITALKAGNQEVPITCIVKKDKRIVIAGNRHLKFLMDYVQKEVDPEATQGLDIELDTTPDTGIDPDAKDLLTKTGINDKFLDNKRKALTVLIISPNNTQINNSKFMSDIMAKYGNTDS